MLSIIVERLSLSQLTATTMSRWNNYYLNTNPSIVYKQDFKDLLMRRSFTEVFAGKYNRTENLCKYVENRDAQLKTIKQR